MDRLTAMNDFYEAHRKASMKTVLSKITGETVDLLSYDEILKRLRMKGQTDRGRAEIPLVKIIGSVGRYTDFTKDFLPRRMSDSGRWASVKMATESLSGVPPIEVYKIGDSYFVRDGNHRVSVARSNGQTHIEAYITEVFTRVPLTGNLDLDSLIIKEEYAGFLEETRLDKLLDESVDLTVTVAGAYEKLLDHIQVHRYYMGIDTKKEITYEEAVIDWYKFFYLPVIETIREHGLMKDFPNRTETDLYIWMLEYRSELEAELGWKIDTDIAAATITERFSKSTKFNLRRLWFWITEKLIPDPLEFGPKTGTWRKKRGSHARMKDLSFFRNILIAMQDNDISRETFEQTIWVAKQEGARISALHLVDNEAEKNTVEVQNIRNLFFWRLHEESLEGNLAVEVGTANQKIVERAVFTDLVVVHLQHAPGTQAFAKLRSGFRTLIRKCAVPLLVVPQKMRPIQRILLAFDGSPKAKEANYIAVYLAKHWDVDLYLLTTFRDQTSKKVLKEAFQDSKRYIIDHNVRPHAHMRMGQSGDTILAFAKEKKIDLILMGSYGSNPVKEMMSGSAIDYVLEKVTIPVLICR